MVYEPQEDSYLMQKAVKEFSKGKVLEIGTGSGILAETAAKKKEVESVLGVDIDPEAVAYCRKNVKDQDNKTSFIKSDIFSAVKGKFDVIIFNPPYLPQDKRENERTALATTGGKKGHELIERFLNNVGDYLEDEGILLLLFSTLTRKEKVKSLVLENMLEYEDISSKRIPFETLHVYKIKKTWLRKELENKGVEDIRLFARGHRGLIYTGNCRIEKGIKRIAVKTQRKDTEARGTVEHEAKVLEEINKEGIGPRLLFSGKDYFAYELVEGEFILDHFEKEIGKEEFVKILKDVYGQMYRLDRMNYNKEEMHHPVKHIVVQKDGTPVLLDFERCRKREKRHNVTQFTQFVVSGMMKKYLEKYGLDVDKEQLLDLARQYSEDYSRERFERLLERIEDRDMCD